MLGHLVAGFDLQALQHAIDNWKDLLALLILNWKFRLLVHRVTGKIRKWKFPFFFSFIYLFICLFLNMQCLISNNELKESLIYLHSTFVPSGHWLYGLPIRLLQHAISGHCVNCKAWKAGMVILWLALGTQCKQLTTGHCVGVHTVKQRRQFIHKSFTRGDEEVVAS